MPTTPLDPGLSRRMVRANTGRKTPKFFSAKMSVHLQSPDFNSFDLIICSQVVGISRAGRGHRTNSNAGLDPVFIGKACRSFSKV